MVAERWKSTAVRALFTAYATAVCLWLLLGLAPTVVAVGSVERAVAWLADQAGPLAALAQRVLETGSGSGMAMVPVGQAVVEYVFSLLNLGLGLLLFARRPDDLVPRLLAFALLGTAATFNMPSHHAFYLIGTPWPVQLIHFTVHIVSGVCYVWAVVLFPDGSWPGRLRLSRRAGRVLVVSFTLVAALISWRGSFLAHPQFFVVFFGIAVPVLGLAAQGLRLRDDQTPADRRALARLLSAALLPSFAAALLWLGGRVAWLLGVPAAVAFCARVQGLFPALFAIVPIVLAAAVLRYRLWDIDRLLSRVLLYGTVIVAIGGCYVVVIAAASVLGGSGLWSTVLALTVAATLIEPVRVRARRWANRVVFGQELSPTEAMRSLISGLEHLTAGREIDQLAGVALTATRATSAAVWLEDHGRLVQLAHAGSAGGSRGVRADAEWPIRYEGVVLGRLSLGVADGERVLRADRETAARIADHAGLVLHNAQLTVRLVDRVSELAIRSEALRQTRRRLVAAQDEERHRLERDLHDGAQQAMVAAIITATTLRPPVRPAARAELVEVLQIARRDLERVLSDARPAALAGGLGQALADAAAVAERSGLSVWIDQRGTAHLDREVEGAVYYCCLESLQNVAKHAEARTVRIDLALGPTVTFTVADDGRGLAPGAVTGNAEASGTDGADGGGGTDCAGGLLQLGSRLAVLGGVLTVENAPSGGVLVRGTVPASLDSRPVEVAG